VRILGCNHRPWTGLMVIFFLVLLYPPGVLVLAAADTPKPSTDNPTAKKIHITADRLISDSAHNNAEFIGNVCARQGDTVITADRLKIFFAGKSEKGNASPTQSMEKLVATGNVEIKFDNRLAVAQQAVYITAQRVLTLTGPEATVTSGDNTISGESITFYREDGRFTVEGGSNGRVKAIILPEESGLE
jgi:lipopolysaccharide export system protein LptA